MGDCFAPTARLCHYSASGSTLVSFCICCPISCAYCWNGIQVCPLCFKLKWNILLCSIFCKLFLNFCNWSAASKVVSSSDDTAGLKRVALKQKLNFHCDKKHDFTFYLKKCTCYLFPPMNSEWFLTSNSALPIMFKWWVRLLPIL